MYCSVAFTTSTDACAATSLDSCSCGRLCHGDLGLLAVLLDCVVAPDEVEVQVDFSGHSWSSPLVRVAAFPWYTHANQHSCVVFAGVHAYYVAEFEKDPNPAVRIIQPLAWQQIGLTWSLLSAMVVALRPFLRDFHTGFGMDLATRHDSTYGHGSNKFSPKGYRLKELSGRHNTESRSANRDRSREPQSKGEQFRADDIQYSAAIYHGARKPSEGSMRSHEPIIRREVEYTVTYETSPTP